MKKLMLSVLALVFLGISPLLAAEHGDMKFDTSEGVRQCALQAESLQEKIKRLQLAIKEGKKTRSPQEIEKLELKLKEAN